MDIKTEMYEADADTTQSISNMVAHIIFMGQQKVTDQPMTYTMSLAISVVSQVFLKMGGNVEKAEDIGEMVKQGIITTLGVYRDMNRVTMKPGMSRPN